MTTARTKLAEGLADDVKEESAILLSISWPHGIDKVI